MGKAIEWVRRWEMWMSKESVLPGVWRRKDGGHIVRARVVSPKTGSLVTILKSLPDVSNPREAFAWLHAAREKARAGTDGTTTIPRFKSYAVSLLARKIKSGEIKSQATKELWEDVLEHHLFPAFEDFYVDQIRRADILAFKDEISDLMKPPPRRADPKPREGRSMLLKVGTKIIYDGAPTVIDVLEDGTREVTPTVARVVLARGASVLVEQAGKQTRIPRTSVLEVLAPDPIEYVPEPYSVETKNQWLRMLGTIINEAVAEYELDRNPFLGVKGFETEEETYTDEEPNSLTREEVGPFLRKMRAMFPQFFAMVYLGFAIGSRPSTLRPLRRGGPTPDWVPSEGYLVQRRSHTRKQIVMNSTKTLKTIRAYLPEDGVAILNWHVQTQLETPKQLESELLFPSEDGGYRSTTCLWKPFEQVAEALGLKKRITPKAMRRTFNDLSRQAGTAGLITRSITGHETEEMQDLYSTVSPAEKRAAISKVINLMGYRADREREVVAAKKRAGGGRRG